MIMPIPVPIPAPLFAVGYLIYTFYAARAQRGRINHDAHFDGALAGLAFVALTDWHAWERAWRARAGLRLGWCASALDFARAAAPATEIHRSGPAAIHRLWAAPAGCWQDLYHRFMTASWPTMFAVFAGFFVVFNLLFAVVYALQPDDIANLNPPATGDGSSSASRRSRRSATVTCIRRRRLRTSSRHSRSSSA